MPAPALLTPLSEDATAIAAHDAVMRRIEAVAVDCAARGQLEDAAGCAQIASNIGWMNHPGRYASLALEGVLAECAASLPPVERAERERLPGPGSRERVLHVLTEGYDTGGHTRLAWRWMLADAGREHSLAVTRHRPVPRPLLDAVAARGGAAVVVPTAAASLLERAASLRAQAAGYDLVLLHVHPDDPVPVIAFGPGCGERPPVLFVNHADHCYWLGREVSDLVVSHRELGSKLTRERRGVPDARTAVLPLPLAGTVKKSVDRDAARAALGIAPGQVVLLTVAADYKFGPIGGAHFLDAAEPVVERHPEALLLAVGPEDSGRFADARRRTGDRVRALGMLSNLDDLYAAADVYLESYPCSSGTAVREAAAYGSPVLTFAPDPVEAEMLGSDAGLADVWQRAGSIEEYCELASTLIRDQAARARWGDAARESVAESHDEGVWVAMVESGYARAAELGPVTRSELAEPSLELTPYDPIVHRIHAYTDKQIPLAKADAQARLLELVAGSPALRLAYGRLAGLLGTPEQRLRYPAALAAPVPVAAMVDVLVGEFRLLAEFGLAERFTMAVAPDDVDAVVPLIEAALAAGPDVDIDLSVQDEPLAGHAPGTLLVVADGDGFGPLDPDAYPHQHRAA